MKRWFFPLALVLLAVPAQAHFIWIIPDAAEATRAQVVMSEILEPDEEVPIDNIAGTKLFFRDEAGKVTSLDWKIGEHAYLVSVPEKGPAVIGGLCKFGVLQRGEGKPYLLAYYPKLVRGAVQSATAWDKLPLEIVALAENRFQVLFHGKPLPDAEVVVVAPAEDAKKLKSDAKGEFTTPASAAGLHGIRTKHFEAQAGEHDGKKFEEIRHYATLVFQVPGPKASADFAPLPRAVSSFGAAVADGWLYVYGGHCAPTHQYSTESVLGTFYRLNLADPRAWEALPSGPPLQGLAVVSHGGLIYRIGGMQPRNRPGDKADNHSVAGVARFDPSTKKWQDLPDLPEARSSHDAAVVGDKIVVVGGWKMNGAGKKSDWCSTALVLDLQQKPLKWQSVKQPFERRALTAAAFHGKVYVGGGMDSDSEIKLTVNIYDPAKDLWTTGPDLPGPERNGFAPAASAVGDRLYMSLGDGKLCRLAKAGDAWEDAGRLKQPRIVHRIVAGLDDLLVAVGGASKGDNIALTEVIRP